MEHGQNHGTSQASAIEYSDDDEGSERVIARVDLTADLRDTVAQAAARQERMIVRRGDDDLAAIIPIEDLELLLRLEEEEEDRIDIEQARKALADPENQERIPREVAKAELKL